MAIISFFMAAPYASYFFAGSRFVSFLAVTSVLTTAGVPILAIIMFISKHIFKTRVAPNFKAGMWSFWIINVIVLFGVAMHQASQFRSDSERITNIDLSGYNPDTLNIQFLPSSTQSSAYRIGLLKISDRKLISSHIHLDVRKSESDRFELKQEKYSKGRDESQAQHLSEAIQYEVQVTENGLIFPRDFSIPQGESWRNQLIVLTLYVPEGKAIHFDDYLWYLVRHIHVDRDQEYPSFEKGQTWVMQENGLVNREFLRKSYRSEEFQYKDFENLQIEGEMKVTIQKGDAYRIELNGKPHYLDKIEFVQLDKTLSITSENNYLRSPIKLLITMPELKSIDAKSTDDVKVQGFTQKSMRVKHDGRDELKIFAKIDSLFLIQSKDSKVDLKGEGVYLDAQLDRSSRLDADRYSLQKAKINAGSNTRISVAVSDSLWQHHNGGARINVDGSPVIIDESNINNEQQH